MGERPNGPVQLSRLHGPQGPVAYFAQDMPRPSTLKRELLLAMWLIGFGLFALPPAVYWVGQQVVGEYATDGGVWALTLDLWSGVIQANPLALLLVLSPYGIIQTLRFSRRLRGKK